VVRNGPTLREAVDRIDELRREAIPRLSARNRERVYNPEWIECLQVENLCTTTVTIARGALAREESRGAHYRRDFPRTDNAHWLKNIIQQAGGDGLALRVEPVPTPIVQPPAE
jgi:succinate dehydrogenase/fumarate reductase flavoprotein subunit